MAKLIHEATGREIFKGEVVTDFRGESAVCTGYRAGFHEGSSGRIYVRPVDCRTDAQSEREYYPSVFGCKIID